MAAVAEPRGVDHGREGGVEAVPDGDRAHRFADEDGEVGGGDGGRGRDGHLVLPRRVLRVQLEDLDALLGEGVHDSVEVGGDLDEAGHAVGGAGARGFTRPCDAPLGLETHADVDAVLGERAFGLAAGELPLAGRVGRAALLEPVGGRPGPAGLGGQCGQPAEVGNEPQVAVGAADARARRHGVVDQVHVEDGRHAHALLGRPRQPREGHGLDPGDARVVHPGEGDGVNAGRGEPRHGLLSRIHARSLPAAPGRSKYAVSTPG